MFPKIETMQKIILFLFLTCVSTFSRAQPPDAQPGKCYAKCLVGDQYSYSITDQFPVFIGWDTAGVSLDTIYFSKGNGSRWIKKTNASDPKSPIWCVENDAQLVDTLVVVVDTTQTDDFFWKTYWKREVSVRGGFTEWNEVMCQDKISPIFIRRLTARLNEIGYPVNTNITTMTNELKNKLGQYQIAHGLPVGSLDFKTLKQLGLK